MDERMMLKMNDEIFLEFRKDELVKWKKELVSQINDLNQKLSEVEEDAKRKRIRYKYAESASIIKNDKISELIKENFVSPLYEVMKKAEDGYESRYSDIVSKIQQLSRIIEVIDKDIKK